MHRSMRIRKPQQLLYSPADKIDDDEEEEESGGSCQNCIDVAIVYAASTFPGSRNWLNKLRAAKGFPVDPDLASLGLGFSTQQGDSALDCATSECKGSSEIFSNQTLGSASHFPSSRHLSHVLGDENPSVLHFYSTMFADLFCMDFPSDAAAAASATAAVRRKRHRKQGKPKCCIQIPCSGHEYKRKIPTDPCPTLPLGIVKKGLSVSPSAEIREGGPCHRKISPKHPTESCKKKEVECYAGSDVFIIDTSLPGWRDEKLIIRQGSSWKIRSKLAGKDGSKCSSKMQTKGEPHACDSTTPGLIEVQRPGSQDNEDRKPEMVNLAHVIRSLKQKRSCRSQRRNVLIEDEDLKVKLKSKIMKHESLETMDKLASDHPVNQPKEALTYSIYQVFMQAGKAGLTAREIVSRILDQGLPGLHGTGVVPRVEVSKIVSNSPYFMPLEDSKYILCSALVGKVDNSTRRRQMTRNYQKAEESQNTPVDNIKVEKHGLSQYWAAIRRARTNKTRRKKSLGPYFLRPILDQEATQTIDRVSYRKHLKFLKQDMTGLGDRCSRTDGKGWHCPNRAKIGYLLCDHHLNKLRARVKPQLKVTKEERKWSGSWM